MVTCKAHNLETANACVGSIPTPTIFYILHIKERYLQDFYFTLFILVFMYFILYSIFYRAM